MTAEDALVFILLYGVDVLRDYALSLLPRSLLAMSSFVYYYLNAAVFFYSIRALLGLRLDIDVSVYLYSAYLDSYYLEISC